MWIIMCHASDDRDDGAGNDCEAEVGGQMGDYHMDGPEAGIQIDTNTIQMWYKYSTTRKDNDY